MVGRKHLSSFLNKIRLQRKIVIIVAVTLLILIAGVSALVKIKNDRTNYQVQDLTKKDNCAQGLKELENINGLGLTKSTQEDLLEYKIKCNQELGRDDAAIKEAENLVKLYGNSDDKKSYASELKESIETSKETKESEKARGEKYKKLNNDQGTIDDGPVL